MESGGFIVGILFAVVVFIILREFWCWFFKLTAIANKLSEISSKLVIGDKRTDVKDIPLEKQIPIPGSSFKIGSKREDVINHFGRPDGITKRHLPDGLYEEIIYPSLRLYFKNEILAYWECVE